MVFFCHVQIAAIMGSHVSNLQGDMIMLLRDENTEVLKGIITHLPDTLTSVCGPLTHQAMHEVKVRYLSNH